MVSSLVMFFVTNLFGHAVCRWLVDPTGDILYTGRCMAQLGWHIALLIGVELNSEGI